MPSIDRFRLLTFHATLFGPATVTAGGFAGANLLKLGFSRPAALAAYAGLLAAAVAAALVEVPSLAVLPASRGIGVLYRSVQTPRPRPFPPAGVAMAGATRPG